MNAIPLLIFESFTARDRVMRALGFELDQTIPCTFMEEGDTTRMRVDTWRRRDDNKVLYVTNIRVPTHLDVIHCIQFVIRVNAYPRILVFFPDISPEEAREHELIPSAMLNPSAPQVVEACALQHLMDDASIHRLQWALQQGQEVEASPVQFLRRYMQMMVATTTTTEADNNDDIEIALQLSREEEQARRDALGRTRTRLQDEWESVLKRAEPKQKGHPLCICCLTSKATICLVDCGCVVLCDDCVREIWTRSSLAKVCPACKRDCTMITRVTLSAMAESDEEAEEPKEKKSKTE